MLYDYVRKEERLQQLRPAKKWAWRSLFARFKKNKQNQIVKKVLQANGNTKKGSLQQQEKVYISVLQCDAGQSLWINQNIQIVVLGFFKGVSYIGIEAPSEVQITKAEFKYKEQFCKDN